MRSYSRCDSLTDERREQLAMVIALIVTSALLSACGGSDGTSSPATEFPASQALACDDTMKVAFKPDSNTTVTLVKAFKAGDPIALSATPSSPAPMTAPHDLCLVKMNIGPGNPGPADAPSTSAGIGVEAWLPSAAVWNKRLQLNGSGGYGGGTAISSLTVIGARSSLTVAIDNKAVSAQTDTGHTTGSVDGSFGMNPDGSLNTTLWKDFADRAAYEMTLKVKALTNGYYLEAPKYSYFQGCSKGGQDGYSLAQRYPEQYDGILVGAPAMHWSQISQNNLYAALVVQRDLGGVLPSKGQRDAVSAAAVSACDASLNGAHDGFISEPGSCRYDPTKDTSMLCVASGGTNATANCVSSAQAHAFNKIWYGATPNGVAPDPTIDVGQNASLSPNQLWFGTTRGTDLGRGNLGGPTDPPYFGVFPIGPHHAALHLQNPSVASPTFKNATGNGADGWKAFSYGQLADSMYIGRTLQAAFANLDTDNPDLTKFRDSKGKLLVWHGMADALVPMQGAANYYTRSANLTGGFVETQKFHRLYFVPGTAHCGGLSVEGVAGVSPGASNIPIASQSELFSALVDWVENDKAPDAIVTSNAAKTNSRPLCPYPKKIVYIGGDVNAAASYACQ